MKQNPIIKRTMVRAEYYSFGTNRAVRCWGYICPDCDERWFYNGAREMGTGLPAAKNTRKYAKDKLHFHRKHHCIPEFPRAALVGVPKGTSKGSRA